MKKVNNNIMGFFPGREKAMAGSFWKRAFLVYACIEVFLLSLQYFITWLKCASCVLPPAFYVISWCQHIAFTGFLWFYLNRFYHLHRWKRVLLNILLFLVYYVFWIGVEYVVLHAEQDWLIGQATPLSLSALIYNSWTVIGKFVLKFTAFYVLTFHFEYRKAEQQRMQLAIINKDLQLNLLKQQLNPHFYFNTLNNLYGLACSNSRKLPEAIRQLHNIMQYVIVDCNKNKVPLSEEVKFLRSYIALEKLRYEKNTVIEMDVQGNTAQKTIVPLLLVQFVENAFKHGMKEKSEKNWVRVGMRISENELLYTVDNSLYETASSRGIGIDSVRHLLNLQYENKHTISMAHEDHCFSVTLRLELL